MFRTGIILALIAAFSCNNTTNQQHAASLHKALADCVTDASLTPEQVTKIKTRINADAKTARLDSIFRRKYKLERFNGNVLIAQQGVVLYRNSFGYAQMEHKVKLRSES